MAYLQVANSRGSKTLVMNGFRYVRNKTTATKIYWRCARRGCNVYLHTQVFALGEEEPQINVVVPPGDHAHGPDDENRLPTSLYCIVHI